MALNWFKKKTKEEKTDGAAPAAAAVTGVPTESAPPPENAPVAAATVAQAPAPETAPSPEARRPSADSSAPDPPLARKGILGRLKQGLRKTRDLLNTDIEDLFAGGRGISDDMFEGLEELLITADVGVQTTMDLVKRVSKKKGRINGPEDLKTVLREEIRKLLPGAVDDMLSAPTTPHVIMVVGVNGVGKTTTIGKMAAKATAQGKKVIIAAADTFRAAAIEQLTIWAERAQADIVRHREHSDPAAVAYDAVQAAVARHADIVLVDTAGRLHTKVNLMEEIKKIKRAIGKTIPDAPHDILLVLDATTGQNAVSQARLFNEALDITGIALTKLDGTAKGGIVISICDTFQIPLTYIGVGEGIDDLQLFDAQRFVDVMI
ncbi:MAG: signal recognition particle-docking protein FtsY [Pseudomonadota bacterium]